MKTKIANLLWWILARISPEDFVEEEEVHEVNSGDSLAMEACGGSRSLFISETVPDVLMRNTDDTRIIGGPARELMFKAMLWADQTNKSLNDFGVLYKKVLNITTYEYDIKMLIVMSVEDAKDFQEWKEHYDELFPITGNKLLPILPDCYTINGTAINHAGMEWNSTLHVHEPTRECMKQWKWIVTNCENKVYATEEAFIFENAADAVHFRLHPIQVPDSKKR